MINILDQSVKEALKKKTRSVDLMILIEEIYYSKTKNGISSEQWKQVARMYPKIYSWDLIAL